jgi:hypothetical protein
MPDEFKYDAFLSHSAKDKAVVRPLAERLRQDGLKVWFDEWGLKPGDSIPAKVEEGLEQSRVLVLCMSADAFGSDWAKLEAGTFRFRDPLNKERRFIPLRLDDAPIKGSLAQFLYIDWRPADREQEYSKLREACRRPETWPQPSETNQSQGDKSKEVELLKQRKLAGEEMLTKRGITHFEQQLWEESALAAVKRAFPHEPSKFQFFLSPRERRKTTPYREALKSKEQLDREHMEALQEQLAILESYIEQSHPKPEGKNAVPKTKPSGASILDSDYVRRRRDCLELVYRQFESIHAFFFDVCLDYISLVQTLHAGVPASAEVRDKYLNYVKEIGKRLREIHVLEGRLAVGDADGALRAMQQYRLQATAVSDMLCLQLPCKTKNEVESIASELFRNKDQLYEELARNLKVGNLKTEGFRFDFGISCAGPERSLARQVRDGLRNAGFQVFLDEDYEHEMIGHDGAVYLRNVYSKECRFCVVLISRAYDKRDWTNLEREAVQARELHGERGILIPVPVEDYQPSWLPESRIRFDLWKRSIPELVVLLTKRCRPT